MPLLLSRSRLISAPSWQTVFNQAITGNAGGFSTVTYRIVLAVANLTIPSGGAVSKVRVTWKAGTAENFEMLGSGIGPKGGSDAYDSTGITRLTYSGSNTGTVTASGTLLSDEATFTWDKATDLVVTFYNNNAAADSAATLTSVTGVQAYSKATAPSDDSQTGDATGYGAAAAGRLDLLQKIEVFA
jgi:hypothetical protein